MFMFYLILHVYIKYPFEDKMYEYISNLCK